MSEAIVYLAGDHRGFALKEFLKEKLISDGFLIKDMGPAAHDPSDDYPDFVAEAAREVAQTPGSFAIVIGHSGQGEAICANRHPGIRAAVYYGGPSEVITLSREHNDANVLSLGAGFLSMETAWSVVSLWLATPFSEDERHVRRIKKLDS